MASTAVPFVSAAHAGLSNASPAAAQQRVVDSFQLRLGAAQAEAQVPIPKQVTDLDEQNYPNFIGNYHKGLPHNTIGEVNKNAYLTFLTAASQGTAAAFEQVPLGGNTKLVNPLAGVAFDLEGTDSNQLAIPPSPTVASAARADEAVELYWMALCRDVNFIDYGSNGLTLAAAAELSSLRASTDRDSMVWSSRRRCSEALRPRTWSGLMSRNFC